MLHEVNRNLALTLAEAGLVVGNEKSQEYVDSTFQPQDSAHWRDGIPPEGHFKTYESGDVDAQQGKCDSLNAATPTEVEKGKRGKRPKENRLHKNMGDNTMANR